MSHQNKWEKVQLDEFEMNCSCFHTRASISKLYYLKLIKADHVQGRVDGLPPGAGGPGLG
jgi:hypothetical protein